MVGAIDTIDTPVDRPANVVGVTIPFSSSGNFVSDRSQGKSAHVSIFPKTCVQNITAAAGSCSTGLANRERNTGSEK